MVCPEAQQGRQQELDDLTMLVTRQLPLKGTIDASGDPRDPGGWLCESRAGADVKVLEDGSCSGSCCSGAPSHAAIDVSWVAALAAASAVDDDGGDMDSAASAPPRCWTCSIRIVAFLVASVEGFGVNTIANASAND